MISFDRLRRAISLGLWEKLAILLCILSLGVIALAGCAQESARRVDLAKVAGAGNSSQSQACLGCKIAPSAPTLQDSLPLPRPDLLRIAVAAMTMPQETFDVYEELLRYVGDKVGKRVELVQRRTYIEVNDLLESQLIDIAFVCSLPYVLGRERFGMELLVAPEVNGEPTYYSYIIVRADSGIDRFDQLRGKTFAFMEPDSNSGALYPKYRLALMGESPGQFFRNYTYTYGHDNSVRAVQNKVVDGAAVESLIFDYMMARDPVLASQVKVIQKSMPFGITPVVVHPALDPQFKEELRAIFLNMDDERGRQILQKMNFDRFIITTDAAYDWIRQMYRVVKTTTLAQ